MSEDQELFDLGSLSGEALTAVEFVQDFLQLRFGEALLVMYTWPAVADADGVSIAFPEPGYRDALCALMGEEVTDATFLEGRSLTVEFDSGYVLAASLREEDLDTPVAGSYIAPSGETFEF